MFCKVCKREIPENSIYCNWCGEKQICGRKKKEEIKIPTPKQPSSFRAMAALHLSPLQQYSCFFDETLLFCFWRCTNGRRLALPGREVMSMVTYGELFAYTLVLIGVATLVFQMCKRK